MKAENTRLKSMWDWNVPRRGLSQSEWSGWLDHCSLSRCVDTVMMQ